MPHVNHTATADNLTAQAALLEGWADRQRAAYADDDAYEAEMGFDGTAWQTSGALERKIAERKARKAAAAALDAELDAAAAKVADDAKADGRVWTQPEQLVFHEIADTGAKEDDGIDFTMELRPVAEQKAEDEHAPAVTWCEASGRYRDVATGRFAKRPAARVSLRLHGYTFAPGAKGSVIRDASGRIAADGNAARGWALERLADQAYAEARRRQANDSPQGVHQSEELPLAA